MSINAMRAKPDLRVVSKWMITGSGSVITAVIVLRTEKRECVRFIRRICQFVSYVLV